MLESGFVTSKCEKCQEPNDVSLISFVGHDYQFKDSIVAMCQRCNTSYLVTLDELKIQKHFS